jgi:hypothetical protein
VSSGSAIVHGADTLASFFQPSVCVGDDYEALVANGGVPAGCFDIVVADVPLAPAPAVRMAVCVCAGALFPHWHATGYKNGEEPPSLAHTAPEGDAQMAHCCVAVSSCCLGRNVLVACVCRALPRAPLRALGLVQPQRRPLPPTPAQASPCPPCPASWSPSWAWRACARMLWWRPRARRAQCL